MDLHFKQRKAKHYQVPPITHHKRRNYLVNGWKLITLISNNLSIVRRLPSSFANGLYQQGPRGRSHFPLLNMDMQHSCFRMRTVSKLLGRKHIDPPSDVRRILRRRWADEGVFVVGGYSYWDYPFKEATHYFAHNRTRRGRKF